MYNHDRYMRNEPIMDWSRPAEAEKPYVPKMLKLHVETMFGGEFGFDAFDLAYEMLEATRDKYPDLTDDELAPIAIADSF